MIADDLQPRGRIERLIRAQVRALEPYPAEDADGLIKLDAMESPYGLPEDLVGAWLETLRSVALNRYPDGPARRLRERMRAFMGVPAQADLILGNGSDELIQIVQMAVAAPGRCVLAPVPTFVMYERIAAAAGLDFVGVPLAADFSLDGAALFGALERRRPAVVFFAYPNNPTGNLFDAEIVLRVARETEGLVVVDEAYHAFSGATLMDRLGAFDNLLILRTVSKLGLAGLRLGMLAGAPGWLAEFEKIRLPYNLNALTQASAAFALEHAEVFAEQVERIKAERARLARSLAALPGVEAFPSSANFILFRVGARASVVFEGLRRQGVLVKNLHPAGGALAGCLRVTAGRPEENEAFLRALRAVL